MSEKSQLVSRLLGSKDSRASYIRAKVNLLIPAQLHALRLRQVWTQEQFAQEAGMKQSRVSAMEQPGAVNFNMETLIRSAATHGVGLVVKFVPFSEMLEWENRFEQDAFNPVRINNDLAFLLPNQNFPVQQKPDHGPEWESFSTTTGQGFLLDNLIIFASDFNQAPLIAAIPEGTIQNG